MALTALHIILLAPVVVLIVALAFLTVCTVISYWHDAK